jgi:hypothetical protein
MQIITIKFKKREEISSPHEVHRLIYTFTDWLNQRLIITNPPSSVRPLNYQDQSDSIEFNWYGEDKHLAQLSRSFRETNSIRCRLINDYHQDIFNWGEPPNWTSQLWSWLLEASLIQRQEDVIHQTYKLDWERQYIPHTTDPPYILQALFWLDYDKTRNSPDSF